MDLKGEGLMCVVILEHSVTDICLILVWRDD